MTQYLLVRMAIYLHALFICKQLVCMHFDILVSISCLLCATILVGMHTVGKHMFYLFAYFCTKLALSHCKVSCTVSVFITESWNVCLYRVFKLSLVGI